MDEPAEGQFRPPYNLAFKTFWTFIEELVARPLPPRIDRSMMRSKSGSDQVSLTAAMKSFGLISANQEVTGLKDLAATDADGRLQWLGMEVRRHYAAQIKVSEENGTEQDLKNSFKTAFGLESADPLRKAMTFFLHAARTAKIEVSPYFPTTRSGSGAPGTPKPRRASSRRKPPPPSGDAKKQEPDAGVGDVFTHEHRDVTLGAAGTVSIDVKVKWLDLSDKQFTDLRKLIQGIEALGQSGEDHGGEDAEGAS